MAKINLTGIISGAQKVLDAVAEMGPVAEKLGGSLPANLATLGIATAAIIQNMLERGKDTAVAMTEQDEGKLRAMLGELQDANDKLSGAINAS